MHLHSFNPMGFLGKYKKWECNYCEKTKMVTAHKILLDNGMEHIVILCKKCWKNKKLIKGPFVYEGRKKIIHFFLVFVCILIGGMLATLYYAYIAWHAVKLLRKYVRQ